MRRDAERLGDILSAIRDIEDFVVGFDEPRFLKIEQTDRRSYCAVTACLIALGEAVKRLSEEAKARHPQVDWRGYAGLRDVITHQYFHVDLGLVWRTITEEVPDLRAAAEEELGRIGAGGRSEG